MAAIEVRVAGKGIVRGDDLEKDASTTAHCGICDDDKDLVVAMSEGLHACRDCIRVRLDATSVARYRLEGSTKGLPWGSIAG